MFMLRLRALTSLAVLTTAMAFLAHGQAIASEPTIEEWRAWALGDVEAATRIYSQSHPGMYDPHNPGFRAQLKNAHDVAFRAAAKVEDAAGFTRTLSLFSAGLRDGHAQAYSTESLRTEWAGMVAARRGDRTWIQYSEVPAVSKGSQVVACDGLSPDEYLRTHVFLTTGRPAEAGQWWQYTPNIFLRSAASARDRPSTCRFRLSDGREIEATIAWRAAPDDWRSLIRTATDGEKHPLVIGEPAPGIFHIGLSDFAPDADGIKRWNSLLSDLRRRNAQVRRARAIILDLRYNNGGSSNWPKLVAEQLWGKDATDTRIDNYFKGVEIWWLAEPNNIRRFKVREAELRKTGDAQAADFVHSAIANLQRA